MPTLSIKDVPESVLDALRQRARRHHRSLQGELMALVSQAAGGQTPEAAVISPGGPTGIARGSALLKPIEQIAREHAMRRSRPVTGGALSGARVRSDRDSR